MAAGIERDRELAPHDREAFGEVGRDALEQEVVRTALGPAARLRRAARSVLIENAVRGRSSGCVRFGLGGKTCTIALSKARGRATLRRMASNGAGGRESACRRRAARTASSNREIAGRESLFRRAVTAFSDVVMPPVCLVCRTRIETHDALCAPCWRQIDFIRPPLCDRLGLPLPFDIGGPMISPPPRSTRRPIAGHVRSPLTPARCSNSSMG